MNMYMSMYMHIYIHEHKKYNEPHAVIKITSTHKMTSLIIKLKIKDFPISICSYFRIDYYEKEL